MIQLDGTLHRRRLREQYLPCEICHAEIDYTAADGMPQAFVAKLSGNGRLHPVHYICSDKELPNA